MPHPLPEPAADSVVDDAAMALHRLRALDLADGTDWSRCDHHQVVVHLDPDGSDAARQRLAAAPPPRYRLVARAAPAPAPPPAGSAPPSRSGAAAAAPADPPSPAEFGPDIDAAATAQALRDAARDGTPFCEECARARGAAEVSRQLPEAAVRSSPEITADELRGKSKDEHEQQARDKGLLQDPKKPNKWRDPVTGQERLRIDPGHIDPKSGKPYDNPRAAVPHVHGYDQAGNKIRDPSAGYDPHFPISP